jgi:hypothetical protein
MTKLGGGIASPLAPSVPTTAGNLPKYVGLTTVTNPAVLGQATQIQFQETQYSGLQGGYNAPIGANMNTQQGGGLRDYLAKVVADSPKDYVPTSTPVTNKQHTFMDDSTGLNFDFKEKIKDSTFASPGGGAFGQSGGYGWGVSATANTQQHSTIMNERNAKTGIQTPTLTSKLVDNYAAEIKQSAGFRSPSGQNSSTFSKEQIEFGDWGEKFRQVVAQNKELKELVITKENHLNDLRKHTAKLEKELQNIMDPLGKSSQLKQKYKETLVEKDKKISDLELENHTIKKELRETTQIRKEVEQKLDGIEAKQRQAMYEMKLQLEEKARKQMVTDPNDLRSLMRENYR